MGEACQLFKSPGEAQKHGISFRLFKYGPPGQGQLKWWERLEAYVECFAQSSVVIHIGFSFSPHLQLHL